MEKNLLEELQNGIKHWYIPLIIGILSIAVGVWTIMTPLESYLALSIVFAVLFFVNGIFSTYFALANKGPQWGWSLAWGIVGIILGVLLMASPLLSAATLAIYVGFMLLFYSVMGLAVSVNIKRQLGVGGTDLLILSILGIILSFIMLWNPALGGLSIVIWTAVAFLSVGLHAVVFAFRLRKVNKDLED